MNLESAKLKVLNQAPFMFTRIPTTHGQSPEYLRRATAGYMAGWNAYKEKIKTKLEQAKCTGDVLVLSNFTFFPSDEHKALEDAYRNGYETGWVCFRQFMKTTFFG